MTAPRCEPLADSPARAELPDATEPAALVTRAELAALLAGLAAALAPLERRLDALERRAAALDARLSRELARLDQDRAALHAALRIALVALHAACARAEARHADRLTLLRRELLPDAPEPTPTRPS